MGQNTCHLISIVLELLLNESLLALIVIIIYESEYLFIASTIMGNFVIDQNGIIFLVIVFEVGG
jgi:hypothetical protein